MTRARTLSTRAAALAAAACLPWAAQAADWSDTSVGIRTGSAFREPFNPNDIHKNIVDLNHVSGYKYGTNFFNVDLLMSDRKDPDASGNGAQEAYIVYRHLLDFGKVSGRELGFGPVNGVGLTAGFDLNTKNDAGYASKKRMLVVGPTLMFRVPGFLHLSALLFDESNAPVGVTSRYHYRDHGALELDWGVPVGALPLSFDGYAQYIGSKGKNEFGGPTVPETHVDASLMLDVGAVAGGAKHTFLLGLEYEYWRNKFGNDHNGPAGRGAFAKTPMVRAEYHF